MRFNVILLFSPTPPSLQTIIYVTPCSLSSTLVVVTYLYMHMYIHRLLSYRTHDQLPRDVISSYGLGQMALITN